MTERRIRTYEKLLGYILIVAVICGIISTLTGCDAFEVDTKVVIDYRYTEPHTEIYSRETDKGQQYYVYDYVQEKYELLWEYTYMDGHKERHWEECTKFEYQNAKEELGG